MTTKFVTPGERLGLRCNDSQESKIPYPPTASHGTVEVGDHILASTVGTVHRMPSTDSQQPDIIQVISKTRKKLQAAVPEVGAVVTGKIVRVNPRQATLMIMVVGEQPCADSFQGIVRVQDVRATERDKVSIYSSFRPGDVVRAEVISLGDSRSYYLSTAKNELGVILATSVAGHTMIPISWEEMICPKTRAIENRKCAKPVAIKEEINNA
ncbi:hypothetical protein HK100_002480 [Physocladia obscura]|uniref:S1 motif domain-containing protein n=1 Tax=Physocladia obscura TaxID=109957 RepID=A0AAD5T9M1_9FUNG|nr:hypothetical protein HK100_002480 [Physocladia obscura]